MTKEEYTDWTHAACDNCHRLLQEFDYFNDEDKLPTKWLCVGRIEKPSNPKDQHEEHNEFRVCLWDDTKPDGKACFDWTPFEVSAVSLALHATIYDYLIDFQPKRTDENGEA